MSNMKNKILLLGIIFILLFLFLSLTHSCSNIWSLLTENGYFIPQESNIFSFNATKMNSGSGGWWLYGEDKKYYYALISSGYLKLQKGKEPEGFNKFDFNTWGEPESSISETGDFIF